MEVLAGTYNGDAVSVYAHPASGGFVMLIGIMVIFSLTTPGAVLSSAFFPGFKISLILITMVLLAACLSPMIYYIFGYFSVYWTNSDTHLRDCLTNIPRIDNSTTINNAGSNFVELVGWAITDQALLCTPAKISILPQIGLFQTLALSFFSEIVFFSEPAEYADQFINQLIEGGASCSSKTSQCTFKYATLLREEFRIYVHWGSFIDNYRIGNGKIDYISDNSCDTFQANMWQFMELSLENSRLATFGRGDFRVARSRCGTAASSCYHSAISRQAI